MDLLLQLEIEAEVGVWEETLIRTVLHPIRGMEKKERAISMLTAEEEATSLTKKITTRIESKEEVAAEIEISKEATTGTEVAPGEMTETRKITGRKKGNLKKEMEIQTGRRNFRKCVTPVQR